jgi:thiosulfate reductase cytochrome b subunit
MTKKSLKSHGGESRDSLAYSSATRSFSGEARLVTIHPAWVRINHWINALAAILMVLSGWEVYDASPLFPALVFPSSITLGGWLGDALLWHFAAMWLLAVNLLIYVVLGISTGRFRRKWWPISIKALFGDLFQALRGKLRHNDLSIYNAVQRFAYLTVVIDLVFLVISGLAIWKPVQFSPLTHLLGGYDTGRIVHFFAMSYLVAFLVVHVAMVMLVPRSLLAMIRGH